MAMRSAVIVRVPLPAGLESLRRRHDPLATRGVPAHVTILVPFVPSDELSAEVRAALVRVAAETAPFEARFARVERFPDAVWLAPEPAAPFREMTQRMETAFPDHPPYEGIHAEVVPHLTIGLGAGADLDRLERVARACPPFRTTVRAIEV